MSERGIVGPYSRTHLPGAYICGGTPTPGALDEIVQFANYLHMKGEGTLPAGITTFDEARAWHRHQQREVTT